MLTILPAQENQTNVVAKGADESRKRYKYHSFVECIIKLCPVRSVKTLSTIMQKRRNKRQKILLLKRLQNTRQKMYEDRDVYQTISGKINAR